MGGEHLLVAAGGTGGHLYPALAVAERFRELAPESSVTFVGTHRGLESRIVPEHGFSLEYVRAEPIRGGSLARKLKGLIGLVQGMVDARKLLKRIRPSVVMGLGAYVSGTVLLAAALRGTPTLILEPNAEPGLANKWLGPFIDVAACAWEETAAHFGAKAVVTGNPVRRSIVDVPPLARASRDRMRVLIFGGSQGSETLNRVVTESLSRFERAARWIEIRHQTGEEDFARVRDAYARHELQAAITKYIDEMGEAYAASDLVVSRAGATTCAELAACGRPSLLVPLPLAGGHQEANAAMMARAGAARWVPQSELTPDRLADEVLSLLDAPEQREAMAARARSLARPEAARRVAEELLRLAGLAGRRGAA